MNESWEVEVPLSSLMAAKGLAKRKASSWEALKLGAIATKQFKSQQVAPWTGGKSACGEGVPREVCAVSRIET